MIWVTWRQQRTLLATALAVVAGMALLGVLERHGLVVAFNGGSTTRAIATFLPAALGVFWGAPLLARPLENHTADLVWARRRRWLALTLVPLGAATLTVALLVRLVMAGALEGRFNSHYRYDVTSVAAIGFTVFAVALGAFVGAVIGRVEPAMLVTLLVYAVVRFVGGRVRGGETSPWNHWDEVRWAEFGWYSAAAVLLIVGTFVVVARRGTSS